MREPTSHHTSMLAVTRAECCGEEAILLASLKRFDATIDAVHILPYNPETKTHEVAVVRDITRTITRCQMAGSDVIRLHNGDVGEYTLFPPNG